MRSSPTPSRMARATVVLPEPVPPATPRMQGLKFRPVRSGSSSGAVSRIDIGIRAPFRSWRRAGIVTGPGSSLASGAVIRAAAGLDDPPHRPAAGEARLPLAVVDGERDLEIAAPPLAVREVVERRPPLGDRLPEHRHRRLRQPVPAPARDAGDRPPRMDPGAVERLRGVDVAHAHHHAGVHEEGLHRSPPAPPGRPPRGRAPRPTAPAPAARAPAPRNGNRPPAPPSAPRRPRRSAG